jgi:ribosomal protein S18 acetylase RimI-like enzyme
MGRPQVVNTSGITGYSIHMAQCFDIRDYAPGDGEFCHALRQKAFLTTFSEILSRDAVRIGADSYTALQFADRIAAMETCVATIAKKVVGFCAIQLVSQERAELLYLFVDHQYRRGGIGSGLVREVECRVLNAHPDVVLFHLDTVVPQYNQGFWERMGYQSVGPSICNYPNGGIAALRLRKIIQSVTHDAYA